MLKSFIEKRPEVLAAYGYGSGVFKQSGYTASDKPQIDLILVVDDLKRWHNENMKLNRGDYSLIGRHSFENDDVSKLKGKTGITYVSNIKEDDKIYKYGTIEKEDLLESLKTWNSFYLPGRLQKPIYPIKEDEEVSLAIEKNREDALVLSAYLADQQLVYTKDLFITLCSFSYMGDTRMKVAENPDKIKNIVEGSFNTFRKLYKFDPKYFDLRFDMALIDMDNLMKRLEELPSGLLEYIGDNKNTDARIVGQVVRDYFEEINKSESIEQTLKGVRTNGICRSIDYASKKVIKKIKK